MGLLVSQGLRLGCIGDGGWGGVGDMANDTADIFVLLLLFFLRVRTKEDRNRQ